MNTVEPLLRDTNSGSAMVALNREFSTEGLFISHA